MEAKIMSDNAVTHIYGVAGIIPGVMGLGLAWGIKSPWSEYALMASGWVAAIVYAVLIWKIVRKANQTAHDHGTVLGKVVHLQEEMQRLQTQHAKEMEQRASAMEFLAGMAMGQRPIPRSHPIQEQDDHE